MGGGECRAFGRAVRMDDGRAGQRIQRPAHVPYGDLLAAGEQFTQPGQVPGVDIHDGIEQRRGEEGRADVVPRYAAGEAAAGWYNVSTAFLTTALFNAIV